MDKILKDQISEAASNYIQEMGISQARLSEISGVKQSHLSHIMQGKYSISVSGKEVTIADKYYSSLARAIGMQLENSYWVHVDTENYKKVYIACADAKRLKERRIIDGLSGLGKSYAAGKFAQEKPNETYLIACKDDYSPKEFIVSVAEALSIGVDPRRMTRAQIRKEITSKMAGMRNPLLIIDEAENLKDAAWSAIKDIADDLQAKAGMVIIGANDFKGQITRKARLNKRAYPQIESRFTEYDTWAELHPLDEYDIHQVCDTLGIKDKSVRSWIVKQCAGLDYRDLKRYAQKILRESAESGEQINMQFIQILFQ
ncbi:MAG: AAA family ATPase [Microscillaceae bacterium]|nr:AAA family ATPase [Microscillaceae bacterium]